MKFTVEQHERNDFTRGMQYETATYVEGYDPSYGTSRAVVITIDGIEFCVSTATRNRGCWWMRDGKVQRAPRAWAQLAHDLANCNLRRDVETSRLFCATTGAALLKHFIDTHDADGNPAPGGRRPTGLHFPLIAPLREGMISPDFPETLGTRFMTGKLDGINVVTLL